MIRVFTTAYLEKNPARSVEYRACLSRNLACHAIDEVCVLVEGEHRVGLRSPRLRTRKISQRPQYADYFAWIDELAAPDDISVIANGDILFDAQLALFKVWELPAHVVLALSRWDVAQDGTANLFDRNDSQDTWILRGRVRPVVAGFQIGVPRCDNRILFELQQAGYEVINPALSICSFHLHDGMRGELGTENLPHYVPPPYRYLFPHNLWSLPRTCWHNLRHPACRLGWQVDRRRLSATLPARVLRKLSRAARSSLRAGAPPHGV